MADWRNISTEELRVWQTELIGGLLPWITGVSLFVLVGVIAQNLKSGEQVKVETKVVETKEVIVVEQSNPQVIYVPSYNPVVVYGPPVYPYPPIYYPPYPPGAAFVSFSFGVMMGAAFWGGSCCGCGWGGNNVNINVNNNFNKVNHYGSGGNNNWNHNPQHRGGAPYGDRATAKQYGGSTRGASAGNRQATAGPSAGRQPGSPALIRPSARATAKRSHQV